MQRGDVAVDLLDRFEPLLAVHVAQLVDRLANQSSVDACFLLRFENILDRHRTAALPEGILLLFRCLDVGMEIDDHARPCHSNPERGLKPFVAGVGGGRKFFERLACGFYREQHASDTGDHGKDGEHPEHAADAVARQDHSDEEGPTTDDNRCEMLDAPLPMARK